MSGIQLPQFDKARVLVVGDLMLDRYWHGGAGRISPEAPVPVVHVSDIEERPGGAANVALNIAALGAHAELLGIVGCDESGEKLEARLTETGVECVFAKSDSVPTITKLRVISRNQQLIRLDFEQDLLTVDNSELFSLYESRLTGANVVILSDYGKGTLGHVERFILLARKKNIPVLIDPKGSDFKKYSGATAITPNLGEFETVTGERYGNDSDKIEQRARALMKDLSLSAILVTRGEHGMTLVPGEEEALHLPTHAREVYDVTGAGDTVISTLGASLGCGVSLQDATRLANLAAGIVVGKLGTAAISESELRLALKRDQEHDVGVVDLQSLLAAVADARARGEKIVMTNGCFDILHAGHVSYLEHARQLGDRLIVAVNDDESVARLKGASRPIVPLDQRMAVLAGLSSVDWVVSFSEDTPERLICEVLPHRLVKGGDYKPVEIAGYECVTGNGGRVDVLPFVGGCSTSSIVNRIKELS